MSTPNFDTTNGYSNRRKQITGKQLMKLLSFLLMTFSASTCILIGVTITAIARHNPYSSAFFLATLGTAGCGVLARVIVDLEPDPEVRSQTAQCLHCKYYFGRHNITCGIHPSGPPNHNCPDAEE